MFKAGDRVSKFLGCEWKSGVVVMKWDYGTTTMVLWDKDRYSTLEWTSELELEDEFAKWVTEVRSAV